MMTLWLSQATCPQAKAARGEVRNLDLLQLQQLYMLRAASLLWKNDAFKLKLKHKTKFGVKRSTFVVLSMPVTRSATRAASTATATAAVARTPAAPTAPSTKATRVTKRKATSEATNASSKKKKEASKAAVNLASSAVADGDSEPASAEPAQAIPTPASSSAVALLPAKLIFSFEEAKKHLIEADNRFADIFLKLPCRPFEKLERVEPFRTLTSSILGQQISWLAARSITHRFLRLYFPHLPEKPDHPGNQVELPFPTPQQVAQTEIATLRSAGLSGRKAEYVQDLAARFADGRLSAQKVFEANDEELYEMLIAVRGIGKWTVDMFAIFSLRRPDIMPAGDLGVQRGVLRWFLSLHNPTFRIDISPEKLPKDSDADDKQAKAKANGSNGKAKLLQQPTQDDEGDEDEDVLPVLGQSTKGKTKGKGKTKSSPSLDESSLLAIPVPDHPGSTPLKGSAGSSKAPAIVGDTPSALGLPSIPTPFTPSINKTLQGPQKDSDFVPRPLPDGLMAAALKTRLEGKKKIKGALLTPQEMESLTEHWKPYRSIAVYYMWALAEEK